MALMYVTEYGGTASAGGQIEVPKEPPLAIQVVTFTTTVASAAFHDETKFVSIQLSAAGHIQFAASPTATTTTSRKHAADAVSFHGVTGGSKVAAVTA